MLAAWPAGGWRIAALYALVALLTALLGELLGELGLRADAKGGLDDPIDGPPSPSHRCGIDRLGGDAWPRSLAGSGVALQVVALTLLGEGLGAWLGGGDRRP